MGNIADMVFVVIALVYAGTDACSYGTTLPTANIGENLTLTCTLRPPCFSNIYQWFNVTGNVSLPEKTNQLLVSQMVLSVREVGGHEYTCQCDSPGGRNCERFKIGVKPKVQLLTSVPVARSGSSVSVTCLAESYPPADSVENYLMKHPKDKDIDQVLLPTMNGVVHHITSASKKADSGEYECTVTVTMADYSNAMLQSDKVFVNLMVYDPPVISSVKTFTISEVGQAAVLECSVSNTEGNGLQVWVNWTTSANGTLREEHVTLRRGNVFYLILNNASAGDYMCRVFSTYSAEFPEDCKIATVTMRESYSLPTTTGDLSKKTDDDKTTWIVPMVLLSALSSFLSITVFVLGVWLHKLRKKKYSTFLRTGDDNETVPNPYEEVHHGSEQHFPHQVSGQRQKLQSQTAPQPITGSKPECNDSDQIQKGNHHIASKSVVFKTLSTSPRSSGVGIKKRETQSTKQEHREERKSLMEMENNNCEQEKAEGEDHEM